MTNILAGGTRSNSDSVGAAVRFRTRVSSDNLKAQTQACLDTAREASACAPVAAPSRAGSLRLVGQVARKTVYYHDAENWKALVSRSNPTGGAQVV